MNSGAEKLISVRQLKKYFRVKSRFLQPEKRWLRAVDGVSFDIHRGETFGLVGESGCGKSTLGRTIVRLYEPTGGEIYFDGTDITRLSRKELRPQTRESYRRRIQVIFQDPYSALNPNMNLAELIDEPMAIHTNLSKPERMEKIEVLLAKIGMKREDMEKFPWEFSGGQRQRIGIARALSVEPEFILCDEPIAALDVSIQAQVVNLLEDFQEEFKLTYLFIAHDIAMVRHTSQRIAVMYLGKLVELAEAGELTASPLHPYTKALLSAVPIADPVLEAAHHRIILEGDVPSPVNPPAGCRFRGRCRRALPCCAETEPELREAAAGHLVACFAV